ncbi:MAG: hypothetical protein ACOC1S_00075 [bacterium]
MHFKNYKILLILIAALAIISFTSSSTIAESHYLAEWEDTRFDFSGEIFVLGEESLNELYSEEEKEDFTLYFTDRDLPEDNELNYSEQELKTLNEYRDTELSYEEILQLAEDFTLITVKAQRPFDIENSDKKVRVDVSEVISIKESSILKNITSHHFLLSDSQLESETPLRIIPGGEGIISYILPKLETDYVNIEIRSFLENSFIRHMVTVEN